MAMHFVVCHDSSLCTQAMSLVRCIMYRPLPATDESDTTALQWSHCLACGVCLASPFV